MTTLGSDLFTFVALSYRATITPKLPKQSSATTPALRASHRRALGLPPRFRDVARVATDRAGDGLAKLGDWVGPGVCGEMGLADGACEPIGAPDGVGPTPDFGSRGCIHTTLIRHRRLITTGRASKHSTEGNLGNASVGQRSRHLGHHVRWPTRVFHLANHGAGGPGQLNDSKRSNCERPSRVLVADDRQLQVTPDRTRLAGIIGATTTDATKPHRDRIA